MLTEEEVKLRILLPFLAALGISPQNVSAERTFRLTLGRHRVTKTSEPDTISGRLDLLVSNEQRKNLFVVEVKREELEITDEDVDQGISYARLLDQIAPFVLVTNGKETRLYDTITKQRVASDALPARHAQWCRGEALASTDDLLIRAEALEHFISYSAVNIAAFCGTQVAESLERLRAEGDVGVFLPTVRVPRVDFAAALDAFWASRSPVFVLAGESGSGKTSEACALAEASAAQRLTLLFRGADLFGTIADRIADEFNWHFSDEMSLAKVARRLARVAQALKRDALIVIDGVDEFPGDDAPQQISGLARRFADHGGTLRLIVSLKTPEWRRFRLSRGARSALSTHAFRGSAAQAAASDDAPSFVLPQFSPGERDGAVALYRDHFGFRGDLSPELKEKVADPFLLRIVAETYAEQELPGDMNQPTLLANYFKRKLLVAGARGPAIRTELVSIAGKLAQRESGGIPVTDCGPAVEEAVAGGYLVRATDALGRESVSFRFERFRDFLIAYEALALDTLDLQSFTAVATQLMATGTGRLVLRSYLNGADPQSPHHDAFIDALRPRMETLVDTYNRLRNQCTPVLRRRLFFRSTDAPVTLLYSPSYRGYWIRAFAPHQGVAIRREDRLRNIFYEGSRPKDLEVSDLLYHDAWAALEEPALSAAALFHEQVANVTAGGGLDEAGSEILAVERLFGIAAAQRSKLGLPNGGGERNAGARAIGFDLAPLHTEQLRRAVHAHYAAYHANMEGCRRGADYTATVKDMEAARARALEGERFEPANVSPREPFQALEEALDALEARGIREVRHHLPVPDLALPNYTEALDHVYSDAALKELVAKMVTRSLDEYTRVARHNLGDLASLLPSLGATTFIVHVDRTRRDVHDEGAVKYGRSKGGETNEALVFIGPADDPFRAPRSGSRWVFDIRIDGRTITINGVSHTGFDWFMGSYDRVPIGWDCGYGSLATPVRTRIYHALLKDWNDIDPAALVAEACKP